jgi:hypothetical protein
MAHNVAHGHGTRFRKAHYTSATGAGEKISKLGSMVRPLETCVTEIRELENLPYTSGTKCSEV